MVDGFFFASSEQLQRPYENPVVRERATPVMPRTLNARDPYPEGTFTNELPVDLVSDVDRPGAKFRSFFEDYYNCIHIIPMFVDFGAVAALSSRPIIIWNAYLKTVDLTGVEIVNGEDLSVEGDTLPDQFLALGWDTYNIIAFEKGTITINATISFQFNAPETVTISVSGVRAKVAPIEPNWMNDYTITYDFKTDMVTTRSNKEQRRALRSTPRKAIDFTGNPRGSTLREFEQVMASWQNNPVIMPEYPRFTKMASLLASGLNEVSVTEVPDWLVPDSLVVLSNNGKYDTRNVSEVSGTTVKFTGVGYEDWPIGTKIHPGLSGRFATSISGSLLTNTVSAIRAMFNVTPASEPVVALPDAPEVFNGRELYMVKPNWANAPTISFDAIRDVIDFDRGLTDTFNPVDFQSRLLTLFYTGRDYNQAKAALSFFCRMKGQAREFYMPTWEQDIILGDTIPMGSTHIRVKGTTFSNAYADSTVFKALTIFKKDGTIYHRVVSGIYIVDDLVGKDTIISLTEEIPENIEIEDVRMISWLPVWRMASDTFTVSWKTNTIAQYQMSMKMLEDLG